ncbi:MAG TPA: helix-turn-helix transcriptional regulator [Pyrinomonadaceae bacterium]|nr:helix-turn-helix transcriptional regulator [Pyrinomonadaceae bacterium]
MGTKPRQRPRRLGEKLLAIRNALGPSQSEMVRRLDVEGIVPSQISEFETGKREPSLIVVLQYARLAGVCVDVLIDDKLDLPDKLPAKPKH